MRASFTNKPSALLAIFALSAILLLSLISSNFSDSDHRLKALEMSYRDLKAESQTGREFGEQLKTELAALKDSHSVLELSIHDLKKQITINTRQATVERMERGTSFTNPHPVAMPSITDLRTKLSANETKFDTLEKVACQSVDPQGSVSRYKRKPDGFHMCHYSPSADWISSSWSYRGTWPDCEVTLRLAESMKLKDISAPSPVILDIGGNIGSCSVILRGRLGVCPITFEPQLKNANMLAMTYKINGWDECIPRVVQAGVGARAETQQLLLVPGNNGGSGFVDEKTLKDLPPSDNLHSLHIVRLDDVVKTRVNFIKMDAQGYELFAMRGGTRLFEELGVDMVQLEFEPSTMKPFYEPFELIEWFHARGYRFYQKGLFSDGGFSIELLALHSRMMEKGADGEYVVPCTAKECADVRNETGNADAGYNFIVKWYQERAIPDMKRREALAKAKEQQREKNAQKQNRTQN